MTGDYLWDGTGEPDPEIERLEAALRSLQGGRRPLALPASRPRASLPAGFRSLAAAAAAALALGAAATQARLPVGVPDGTAGWDLAWLEGSSWPQARVMRKSRLTLGERIDTREGRARLLVGEIGEVRLEPATRVGLVDAGRRSYRLSLERGVMHAMIWAPPGRFLVDTPSAVAVDLGCRYTLEVKDDGSGLLRVEAGWVGFEHQGQQSLVPAGAACATRRGVGPGTPYNDTAPEALRQALAEIDFGPPGDSRRAALHRALAAARGPDALSLWHLLSRLGGEDRGRVFDRLALLVSPPGGVTRDGIVRGDRAMRDLWWNQLGLGSANLWRGWTSRWSEPSAATPDPRLPAR